MRAGTGAALGALLLALAGCSALDSVVPAIDIRADVTMTPAEARADLARRSDDLQELIGGTWDNQDNFIASGCGKDDRGFYYYGGRARFETVTDIPAVADRIEAWWKGEGYAVTHQVFLNDHLLHGVAPNGMVIDVSLGEDRTYFSTDGPCILGDWYKISLEDGRNHRNDFPRTPMPTPVPAPPWPMPTP